MQLSQTKSIQPADGQSTGADRVPVNDPRVYLAAERTFLSWVRTSVALMGFGFLIARFAFLIREYAVAESVGPKTPHTHPAISPWLGFGMVVLGVIVLVVAAGRHRTYIHQLRNGVANPFLGLGTSLTIAAILALVGLAMSVQILLF